MRIIKRSIVIAGRDRRKKWRLKSFVDRLSDELCRVGRERTARAYHTVLRGLTAFTGSPDLAFESITPELLHSFERGMREKGRTLNTVSFYMRNLRAIYNKAVGEGLAQAVPNLFEGVYTGVQVTRKRALSKEEMRRILEVLQPITTPASAPPQPPKGEVDLFLFSFYARGMSFVDMAYLRKSDLRDGVITYTRRKTGQVLEVKVTPEMRHILRGFEESTKDSPYLLPLIFPWKGDERRQYESALRLQNVRLKRLGALCGIVKPLSTHVARHTWATIAKCANLPLTVISEGLGHSSVRTTSIYLASFERSVIDRANEKVIRCVKRKKQAV